MFKKILALALCLVMLIPATGTFAGKVESTNEVVYTDDFEHLEITEDVVYAKGEAYSAHATSDVFSGLIHNGNMAHLVVDEGKDGSKAFKLTAGNTNNNTIYTITPTKVTQSYDNLLLTCDIKISYHTCTTATAVALAGSNAYCDNPLFYVRYDATTGTNYIANESGTKLAEYDDDKWYKLVVRKRVQDGKTYAYLADENGNLLAEASRTQGWGAIVPISNKAAANSGAELIIDNVVLRHYRGDNVAPKVVTAPSIANRNDVPTNTNSTSFDVDDHLYVDSPATATLTAEGDTKTCTVTRDASKLYTYNISWDGSLLEETEYTLKISGMKYHIYNATSSATYTFKTAESPNPDVVSSVPANGAENVYSELKQMTVTFNKEITEFPQTVTLTSENDTVTANVSTSDNKAFTFIWTDELDGMATYTVNLEAFKNADGLTSKTKTLSFTTGNADMQTFADSFEDSSLIFSYGGYNYSSNRDPNKSIITMEGSAGSSFVKLVDGYTSGTKALQLTTGTAATTTYLNPVRTIDKHSIAEGETLVATWRFRLDQMATYDTASYKYGPQICLGTVYSATYAPGYTAASTNIRMLNGKLVVYSPSESTSNAREISEDKWYNMIYVLGRGTEAFYFIDAETNELVYKRAKNYYGSSYDSTNYNNYIMPVSAPKTSKTSDTTAIYNENQIFTIDDFKLWKIKPGRSTHKLASSGSITEDDGTVTINFNQPVLPDDDMFSLYYGDDELVYKRPEVKYTDFCKAEISYTGLDELTDYTLDYSGVEGISGADIGNKAAAVYEFISDPADSDVSVVGDVYCTGLTSGSTITANVYSNEARTVDILAAFYEKTYPAKLQTVVLTGDVELGEGQNPVTIDLNRNINANVVKLFLWENGTLVPLMEEYKTLTPVDDTLDILFIGSSLSEDSGRLFDQILKAAGHNVSDNRDINVTVKFVGGGSFVYHYNNLKREIDSNLEEAILNGDTDTLQAYVDTQNGIMAGTIASSDADKTRRLYTTFENGVTQKDSPDDYIMLSALMEKQYDFISLQPSAHAYDYNSMVNGTEEEDFVDYETELSYITSTIREYQPNAEIVLFQTWTHYYGDAPYGDQARRHKYFTNLIKPYVDKWAATTGENVENITDGGEAMTISPVGYAFYLADEFLPWAGNMYCLDSGNNTADAKAEDELRNKFNTSQGLLRDADHASYYGTFLADAVWYELFTGNRASAGTVDAPAIARPTGNGPLFQNNAIVEGQTKQYFTITAEEHLARLEQLADIAHQAVKEYNTLKRMVKIN